MYFQRITRRIWLIKWKQVLNKNFQLSFSGRLINKEREVWDVVQFCRKREGKRLTDGKGTWVSISFKIKWEVRDVSPIGLTLSHMFLLLCADFCRETIRDHAKLLRFEFILNTTVSPRFLSRELLLQGFCHSWHPPTLTLVSSSWEYFPLAATAAKSPQSCPTLCDPVDGNPAGSAVPGILQATLMEWAATSFSSEWKWKVKVKSLSRVPLFATPWTVAYQAPPSMARVLSRQEYWSGLPLPSPVSPWNYLQFNEGF